MRQSFNFFFARKNLAMVLSAQRVPLQDFFYIFFATPLLHLPLILSLLLLLLLLLLLPSPFPSSLSSSSSSSSSSYFFIPPPLRSLAQEKMLARLLSVLKEAQWGKPSTFFL